MNKNTTGFYVIERHHCSVLEYFYPSHGTTLSSKLTWTKKIDEACKFWDADSAAFVLSRLLDGIGNVVEHAYISDESVKASRSKP